MYVASRAEETRSTFNPHLSMFAATPLAAISRQPVLRCASPTTRRPRMKTIIYTLQGLIMFIVTRKRRRHGQGPAQFHNNINNVGAAMEPLTERLMADFACLDPVYLSSKTS